MKRINLDVSGFFKGFFIIGIILFLSLRTLHAESEYFEFEDNLSYDIYFYSGENFTSVIERATIEGFQDIGDKQFLVIRSKGFKLNEEVGFILFDSIIAILPDRNFKVRKTDKVFHHY